MTVLTLDAATELRPRSRQQVLFTPRAGGHPEARRQGGRRRHVGSQAHQGLPGAEEIREATPGTSLRPPRERRTSSTWASPAPATSAAAAAVAAAAPPAATTTAATSAASAPPHCRWTAPGLARPWHCRKTLPGAFRTAPCPVSPALARVQQEEDRAGSVDSVLKDLQSPVPSFPPLSPAGGPGKGGAKSENSFYSSRHNGQSPSLLVNHFGFSTIRPDTFSGNTATEERLKVTSADNDGKSAGSRDRMIYERRSQSSVCSRNLCVPGALHVS